MNFEFIENIYKSRITLLDILDNRGYDVERFRKFSPNEIFIAASEFQSLSFKAFKKDDNTSICDVRYMSISRNKIDRFFDDVKNPEKIEIIIMMEENVVEYHHICALKQYVLNKLRVSFFSIPYIVNNPLHHTLVPPHKIVPLEEHQAIMNSFNITNKTKFPLIRYHVDPIVRVLGAVPGDIIEILRPSPSAGVYKFYRVVSS